MDASDTDVIGALHAAGPVTGLATAMTLHAGPMVALAAPGRHPIEARSHYLDGK